MAESIKKRKEMKRFYDGPKGSGNETEFRINSIMKCTRVVKGLSETISTSVTLLQDKPFRA